jgi:hypothetical protein
MKPKRISGLCPLMNLNLLPVSRKKKPLPKPITRYFLCNIYVLYSKASVELLDKQWSLRKA